MSSSNPFGLAEISHFGSFQRVGGKAGGFINKKFFHPSTLQNQEKLWKAQTEDETRRRRDFEMEKRRNEERQVEDLKKQMYLSGQGKHSDFLATAAAAEAVKAMSVSDRNEQKLAIAEQQKRRAMIKKEQNQRDAIADQVAEEEDDESDAERLGIDRVLMKSRYPENVLEAGHTSVWGSWFSMEAKKWGFGCCKVMKRETPCPDAAPEEEKKEKQERGRKRRRKGGAAAAAEAEAAEEGADAAEAAPAAPPRKFNDAELIDTKMIEAAERRKAEAKKLAAAKGGYLSWAKGEKEEKKSDYLADLLQEPGAEPET